VEWPPLFETNGSEYIFDIRSEMFYEPNSDYFYDPKSKLYYSNQKKAYFRYDESKTPAFEKVTEADRQASDQNEMGTVKSEGSSSSKSKKSITISIKSTESSLAGSRVQSVDFRNVQQRVPPVAALAPVAREVVSESSSETGERRRLAEARDNARAAVAQGQSMGEIVVVKEKTMKTASGKPICTLCRRKFPSIEILRRHEKESGLHKKNLIKQMTLLAATEKEKPKEPPVVYTDRASKRRQMHGEESSLPPRPTFVLKETVRAPPVAAAAVLGKDNIGHQLFKKMMGDTDVPVRGAMEESLRKDWERVEEMSNGGGSSARESKAGLSFSHFNLRQEYNRK